MSTESHDGLFSVWVTDDGQGVTPTVPSPGLGLGLEVMARLCERVVIGVLKDGRTQVEMRFDLRVANPVPADSELGGSEANGRRR
jgi:hypothetical protein